MSYLPVELGAISWQQWFALDAELSVIIPTINEEACIEKTLKAIVGQRASFEYEVLVCDGGSTDGTCEIAEKYARVIVSPTRGEAAQLNFAAKFSRGEILVFIGADTLVPRNYLQHVYESFKRDENLWACGAPLGYLGKGIRIKLGNISYVISRYFFINVAMYLWYIARNLFHFTEIPGCNTCVRRDIYLEVGGFKQPTTIGVDVAFSYALRELSKKKRIGRVKVLKSLVVWTSPRHISLRKSIKRVKNYRKIILSAQKD
jgi:cellulose synthase/poly-beta-1,6-N-acetylglucosamine synthase-like glycosyltransferase